MATKLKTPNVRDNYLDLVRQFPLKKISTKPQHDAALEVLRPLAGRDGPLTDGEADYFDALVALVSEYEHRTLPLRAKVTPLELLKHLMEEGGLSVNDVGKIIGSQPAASMIVNGKRAISKAQAKRLGERFCLNAGAFI